MLLLAVLYITLARDLILHTKIYAKPFKESVDILL